MSALLALAALLALFVAALTRRPSTHNPLRRPPRLRRFVGRLKQLARRCVIRTKQAVGLAPTSRSLLRLKPEAQIAAHLKHRDLYASEGTGLVYVCAAVRKRSLAAFRARRMTREAFLDELSVKLGCTEDLIERKKGYRRCNKNGQTHLWFWCFRVERRCVGERLCHLFGDRIAPRTGLQDCTGCTATHRDYLKLSTIGFDNLMTTMKDVFAQLGEPALVPIELENMEIAGL
ncbi:hypothetical protein C8R46DRAFT_1030327 [Mycena filopes]|nr:hypothetical protein C8R46DRAFT_1030327 [Mycena filopes]